MPIRWASPSCSASRSATTTRRPIRPGPWSTCRSSTSPARCRCCSNSFVIGRTMVLMPKWDAGEALRLIEKETITYFVGVPTMSLELMQHPDRGRYDLSVADRHRGGRRAAAGRPCRPARGQLPRRPAGARLWPDRDQCGGLRQFLVQLSRQARLDRPRPGAVRRARHIGRGRPPSADGRARRDRDPLGLQHPRLLGRRGGDRAPPSPPTSTSRPATSAISTRTAICSSSTARRTSSSAAARISRRRRWRRRSTRIPPCPRRRCSELPTSGWARCPWPWSIARRTAPDAEALRAFLAGRLAPFKLPAAHPVLGRAAAQARHRQDRQGLAPRALSRPGRRGRLDATQGRFAHCGGEEEDMKSLTAARSARSGPFRLRRHHAAQRAGARDQDRQSGQRPAQGAVAAEPADRPAARDPPERQALPGGVLGRRLSAATSRSRHVGRALRRAARNWAVFIAPDEDVQVRDCAEHAQLGLPACRPVAALPPDPAPPSGDVNASESRRRTRT